MARRSYVDRCIYLIESEAGFMCVVLADQHHTLSAEELVTVMARSEYGEQRIDPRFAEFLLGRLVDQHLLSRLPGDRYEVIPHMRQWLELLGHRDADQILTKIVEPVLHLRFFNSGLEFEDREETVGRTTRKTPVRFRMLRNVDDELPGEGVPTPEPVTRYELIQEVE